MCIYNSASSTHQVIHGGFCARDPQPPAAPRPVNMHSLLPHLSSALPAIICPIHLSSESFQRKTYELRSVPEVVSRHPFPARLPLRTRVTWEKMATDTFRRVDSVNKRCLQPVPFFLRPCYNVGKLRLSVQVPCSDTEAGHRRALWILRSCLFTVCFMDGT